MSFPIGFHQFTIPPSYRDFPGSNIAIYGIPWLRYHWIFSFKNNTILWITKLDKGKSQWGHGIVNQTKSFFNWDSIARESVRMKLDMQRDDGDSANTAITMTKHQKRKDCRSPKISTRNESAVSYKFSLFFYYSMTLLWFSFVQYRDPYTRIVLSEENSTETGSED